LGLFSGKKDKTTFEMAMDILGEENFITPERVMKDTKLKYSEKQMLWIYASMPQDEEWYNSSVKKDIILHPGAPQPMNLFDVRKMKPANFCLKGEGWWTDKKEVFSFNDYVNLQGYESWCAIKKVAVENSFNELWKNQQKRVLVDEFVPNASQLGYSMSIIEQTTGVRLFPDYYVRTSSVDSDGGHVALGFFGGSGLDVFSDWNDFPDSNFGLVVSRKLVLC
jgi:hypothetical protein